MCVNTWCVCQGHRNEIKSYPPSVALCVDSALMPLDFLDILKEACLWE